jgi:hypothetical protein
MVRPTVRQRVTVSDGDCDLRLATRTASFDRFGPQRQGTLMGIRRRLAAAKRSGQSSDYVGQASRRYRRMRRTILPAVFLRSCKHEKYYFRQPLRILRQAVARAALIAASILPARRQSRGLLPAKRVI